MSPTVGGNEPTIIAVVARPAKALLLVEDDADLRESLVALFARAGYAVSAAEDGLKALEYMQTGVPPRLVFLDLMMPNMSGWDLVLAMGRDRRLADIPVVVLSSVHAGSRPKSMNIVAYLTKPPEVSTLLSIAEEFCHGLERSV